MQGRQRPSPTRNRKRRPLNPRIRKRGEPSFLRQASGLCLSWGALEASFVPGSHPPNQTPSPPPVRPLLCQLGRDNKRHPLPRLPSPSRRRSGGWEGGAPRAPRGPAEISLTIHSGSGDHRREQGQQQQPRRGQHGVGRCKQQPPPSGPLTSRPRPPPQLGGPPFIFLSPGSSILILFL